MFGEEMTVDQVMDVVEQDASFYRQSGGGMTLSGGECLMYPDFAAALLKEAHARGISTAIETAGNVPWRFMEQVLPHVDIMLHDNKLMDSARHKKVGRCRQRAHPRRISRRPTKRFPRSISSSAHH